MSGEARCGLLGYRPACLQRFTTVKSFVFVYSLLGAIQAASYLYLAVTLQTLEKRFRMPSKVTGIVLSGNEISQILLSTLLAFYGGRRNRPVWISWGVIFSGVSCFVVALPHLLYGPGEVAIALSQASANVTAEITMCDQKFLQDFSVVPLIIIFLSQFILGVGNALYYSLGNTYLDDNNEKKKTTPILLGLSAAFRMLGPALGFVLSSLCLRIYIDPSLKPTAIGRDDPRWLGAWWLGWVVLGVALMLLGFLVAMFPERLPGKGGQHQPAGESQPLRKEKPAGEAAAADKSRSFVPAVWKLTKNRVLMYNISSTVFYVLGGSGFFTYFAKYIETQFQRSISSVTFSGPITLGGMMFGTITSGFFLSKFRPSAKIVLGWNVITGVASVAGYLIYSTISCDIPETVYNVSGVSAMAIRSGPCPADCSSTLMWFLGVSFVVNFVMSTGRIGNLLVNYRCVRVEDKSLAQGLALGILSLVAFIPGPIIYGYLIDFTCLVWEHSCNQKGNCWMYDRASMRVNLNLMAAAFTCVGAFFDFKVWQLGKNLKLYEDDDTEKSKEMVVMNGAARKAEALEAPSNTIAVNRPDN